MALQAQNQHHMSYGTQSTQTYLLNSLRTTSRTVKGSFLTWLRMLERNTIILVVFIYLFSDAKVSS